MSAPDVVQWICRELTRLLGIDAPEDIAQYILAIESKKDLEEYMFDLLDPNDQKSKRFVEQLVKKWRPPARQVSGAVPQNVQVYRKETDEELFPPGPDKTKSKKKNKKEYQTLDALSRPKAATPDQYEQTNGVVPEPQKKSPPRQQEDVKKKTKFVPLFSEEGHAKTGGAKLPGRHVCECQAAKHDLINNCTKCGRVVCEQEGSGPCLFCGALVCTREEQEVLARGSKKSEKLREKLMGDKLPNASAKMQDGLERARKHKDKLLEYDRTSVKRTQVIDDESDYYATDSNTWLSKTEKNALKKREEELRSLRHVSKKDRKITLDFAGRRVTDSDEKVDMYNVNDKVIQEVHYGAKKKEEKDGPAFTKEDFGDLVNPSLTLPPPTFVLPESESAWSKKSAAHESGAGGGVSEKKKSLRLQDRDLQTMSDEGVCMSMHQPWASLLTSGIKIHEGRTWYTAHRGRLWIAATVKAPAPQEIAELEQQYRFMYDDADVAFPDDYPVGCLLGCVDVVDCLAQEEYRQKYPDGESASPFVFICESPRELVVKFPIKGKHKIYKLDSHIHQAAKKGLRDPTH